MQSWLGDSISKPDASNVYYSRTTSELHPKHDIPTAAEQALTMAGDSQASFSQSVKNRIHEAYQYRCVICLAWIDTTQLAHILDAATQGVLQVRSEATV